MFSKGKGESYFAVVNILIMELASVRYYRFSAFDKYNDQ